MASCVFADLDAEVHEHPEMIEPTGCPLRILDIFQQHTQFRGHQAGTRIGDGECLQWVRRQPSPLKQPAIRDVDDHGMVLFNAVAEQHRHPGHHGGRVSKSSRKTFSRQSTTLDRSTSIGASVRS